MAVLIVKGPAAYGARLINPIALVIWDYDITTAEAHSHAVEWTSNPVETGLAVTDHAIIQPDELTLSGWVTDTPLGPAAIPGAVLPDRAADAYQALLDLQASKVLLTVVTGIKVYTNMGIVSVTANRNPGNGQTVRPTIKFKKIRKVFSVEIPIPAELLKPVVKASGQSPVDAGVQPPTAEPYGPEVESVEPEAGAADSFTSKSTAAGLDDVFTGLKDGWAAR